MSKATSNKLVALALSLMIIIGVASAAPMTAFATTSETSYAETNVLEDLLSSSVNGKPFNIKDYPYNQDETIQIISFIEYCYSYRENMINNYGLYIYVYNPQGFNILDSESNKIQMAVYYDEKGNPASYEKFNLKLCNKSQGDYNNLFYKFKVIDKKIDGKLFCDRVNSNERRYDVSGVELLFQGANNTIEYSVCGRYIFTGYAQGYGPEASAKSSLSCTVDYSEAVELSVKHTFYRSKTSSLGAGHQNQLDTVYFSLPKFYLEMYGNLQRIKAEWYEYKTNEIAITSNKSFYNAVIPYVGAYMGDLNEYGMYHYVKDVGYGLAINPQTADINIAAWGWNLGTGYLHPACQRLTYLFYADNISGYDPYANITTTGGVQSNTLYDWIISYDKSYAKGTLPIKDGTISADLFADDIDENRKMNNSNGIIQKGYSYYDFDANIDLQTLQSWSSNSPSFWDNWLEFGLGAAFTGGPDEETVTVPPIQILTAEDLVGTDNEIAERLLINVKDVCSIKDEFSNLDNAVVLFRFATSDYYSEAADIIEPDAGFLWSDKITEGQAYIAKESVFFDFDIIQLTFNKDGQYIVIPVVSSPIDIVNDITPPVNFTEGLGWWKVMLALLLLVLLIVLIYPLLPHVIQVAIWFIVIPFKAIGLLIKRIAKRIEQKSRNKE